MKKIVTKTFATFACLSLCSVSVFAKKAKELNPNEAIAKLAPVERKASKPTEGVYYSMFVRSFADSNKDGNGDFNGIVKKLDYLNDGKNDTTSDLGITGIWLLPIFPSGSYHGYNVDDYYNVNPEYGTMKDFENMISECHKRGISVIIDMTCNHSSNYNDWFIKSKDPKDPHRAWYRWITEDDLTENGGPYNEKIKIWGHNFWNMDLGNPSVNAQGKEVYSFYGALFDTTMPDFDMDCQAARDEFKKVFKFWLDKGVDGFRFDAAGHIYNSVEVKPGTETLSKAVGFWKEMTEYVKSVKPDAYMVAEVWEPNAVRSKYYGGMPSNFHFNLGTLIKDILNNQELNDNDSEFVPDTDEKSFNGYARYLESTYADFGRNNPNYIDAPFLSNHDQVRSAANFNGKNKLDKMKMAANLYILIEGVPFIYYGEEIAMRSGTDDPSKRTALVWKPEGKEKITPTWYAQGAYGNVAVYNKKTEPISVQEKNPDSILQYYKRIIRLKTAHPALYKGRLKAVSCASPVIESYAMECDEEKAFVIHNVSSKDTVTVSIPNGYENLPLVFTSKQDAVLADGKVTLPPYCSVVLAANK